MNSLRSCVRAVQGWSQAFFPSISDRDLLAGAIVLGLVGGLAESVTTNIAYWIFHRTADGWVTGELYWMSPLTAAAACFTIALAATVLRRVSRQPQAVNGAALFLIAAVCFYSVGRVVRGGLHPVAVVVLSVGLAAQVTRLAGLGRERFGVWTVRLAALGLVAVAGWALTQPYRTEAYVRLQKEAKPASVQQKGPNVLVIVWDTVRARSLSLYGYQRQTSPNLDAFAKRAVVFDSAVTPASWTLPAHASLFTGRYHHEHSADRESPLDGKLPTLAEALRDRGYRTGGFVANNYWLGRGFGLDRGFQWYEDQLRVSFEALLDSWWISDFVQRGANHLFGNYQDKLRIPADTIDSSFLTWVDQPDGRPFFAFLNLFDAHEPYLPPGRFGFKFSDKTPRYYWDYTRPDKYPESQLQEMRDAYDSCIYYLDYRFGVLLKQLEQRGLLDNTFIVVTADHGEALGEHQPELLGHETSVYYDVLNVPLVMFYPSRFSSGTRRTPVSLVDVSATILDLVDPGHPNPFPGMSLRTIAESGDSAAAASRMLLSQANPARWHRKTFSWPIAKGPLFSLVDGKRHYTVNAERTEQLFDLSEDPWERRDLSETPSGSVALGRYRAELEQRGISGVLKEAAARR